MKKEKAQVEEILADIKKRFDVLIALYLDKELQTKWDRSKPDREST